MDLSKLVPLHRIEVRRAGSKKSEPWIVAELAHTDAQLAVKLGFWKKQEDIETRTVDNFSVAADPVVALKPAAAPAPVVEPVAPPVVVTSSPGLTITMSKKNSPAPVVATAPAVVATPVPGSPETVTGATPLPFGVGDFVRDVHTGVKVRVTAINPDGRAGFSWEKTTPRVEGDADHTGFCPLASVGAFESATEKSPATTEPSGVETPAPEVKPPATRKTSRAPKAPRASKKKTPGAKPAKPSRAKKHK